MSKAAFIGLGAMGSRMAANLLKAGHEVTVYDLAPEPVKKLADSGAKTAPTARKAAEGNDFVLTMVRDDEVSRKVWLDAKSGALAGMKPGAVAIECSTVSPAWIRELGDAIGKTGIAFLEAPISGSTPQARNAQLVFLVGGEADTLQRVEPLLRSMGTGVQHAGPVGAGALAKLITNTLMGVQLAAIAEMIGMLKRYGIDPKPVLGAVAATPLWSPHLTSDTESMLSGDFESRFPVKLLVKDLGYTVSTAGGEALAPTLSAVRDVFQQAMTQQLGDLNVTAVVKLFAKDATRDSHPDTTEGISTPARNRRQDMRKVLITGAGTGFGREVAMRLAHKGFEVIAAVEIYAQVQTLKWEAAERGVKLQVVKLDVTNEGDRKKALRWNVEILVNNAGVLEGGSVVDIPGSNMRNEFEVNVIGPLLLTQGIAKQMVKRGKGRIVWVSSREGINVNPFTGIYSASKHAVEAIAETMSLELQEFGIQVATINPGPFLTGFNDRGFQTWEGWEDDASQRLFDYSKLAFPRAQFDPEPVYATMAAVVAGEIDSYRNLEPKSMMEETKRNIEAPWTKKVTDGLGSRPASLQNSFDMTPETPVESAHSRAKVA